MQLKRTETRWDEFESFSVARALSHVDTLEISRHSHTIYIEYCCQLWNPLKLLGKTARTQIILSPETPRTLYNYIYLEDNTTYGAKY